jgi:hypothetical protein
MRAFLFAAALLATTALAWNHEYAWYDPAAPTAAGKPGAGGVFGTGAQAEGGIQCAHCHTPLAVNPSNPLRVLVTFTPPMTNAPQWDGGVNGFVHNGGTYAPNTNYTVNVRMLNEHLLKPDGGAFDNNFAGLFEDSNGVRVGAMTTDTGIDGGNCPQPNTAPTAGTTHMYRRCDAMFSRYISGPTVNSLSSWTFSWRSPASAAGVVTFAFGVVDGSGDDRTRGLDGGPNDDVVMGKINLSP